MVSSCRADRGHHAYHMQRWHSNDIYRVLVQLPLNSIYLRMFFNVSRYVPFFVIRATTFRFLSLREERLLSGRGKKQKFQKFPSNARCFPLCLCLL